MPERKKALRSYVVWQPCIHRLSTSPLRSLPPFAQVRCMLRGAGACIMSMASQLIFLHAFSYLFSPSTTRRILSISRRAM